MTGWAGPPLDARSRWVRPLAFVVVVLLVVGLVVAVRQRDGGGESASGADAGQLRALIPDLEHEAERLRGLTFERPVRVELLNDAAFRRRLTAQNKRDAHDREELRTTGLVLQALHLVDRGVDLEKSVDSLLGQAVAGFYDAKKDELVVRGTKPTPSTRATLVHELTHALQDQHFELDRPALNDRDDEAATGFSGLVEGDASRVQQLYLQSLPVEEQRRAEAEEGAQAGGIDPSVPRVLIELIAFPYIAGPRFTEAVVAAGGQARLDAAFAAPPTTSEQLLHPDKFLAGEGVQPVPLPAVPAGKKKIDSGVFGELPLLLVLASAMPTAAAADASGGWGGDGYVAWRDGGRACVRVAVAMDTPGDRTQLVTALQRWSEKHGSVTLTTAGSGPVTFTACG